MANEIGSVIRWWVALMVLGAVATPLAWHFFRGLPMRGYAFTKPLGLLLVSYLFWILGSFGFLGNTTGGAVFALLIVLAGSVWVQRRQTKPLADMLREQWRYMLTVELIFLGMFLFWAWVRAQNPIISGTEKPMEFAFLTAIGRSPTFPPHDPWLSGFAISYYYFGYVMVSVIARLSMVADAVAFNLGIAWLFAGTGVGAFGIIYELIVYRAKENSGVKQMALILGLVGALALPMAGNLEVILELAHSRGIGSAEFWQTLDIKDINTAPNPDPDAPPRYTRFWWWWRSSRVINEHHLWTDDTGEYEESGLEPIAEFPGFSFVLGDMHPHVLALPFAFLSMAVALTWYLGLTSNPLRLPKPFDEDQQAQAPPSFLSALPLPIDQIVLTGLVVGGFAFLNTWDILSHLFLVVGAFALTRWQNGARWTTIISHGLGAAVGLVVLSAVLYLPFFVGFDSQAGGILPMLSRPTWFRHFGVIFGMPLFAIVMLLGTLFAQQKFRYWKQALLTTAALIVGLFGLMFVIGMVVVVTPEGNGQAVNLAGRLGVDNSGGFATLFALLPTLITVRFKLPFVILLLTGMIGLCVALTTEQFKLEKPQQTLLPFVLLLILTAALLTVGPEFVYLRDQFGQRLNTVFKFYYQAWALFGVAAVVGLYLLLQRSKIAGMVATIGYLSLFVGAMMFPYFAIQSRMTEFGGTPTLDGLAHVSNNNPDEREAVDWLRDNTEGIPVIAEAVGGSYTDYARVATRSGLPNLLGWPGHERQWRGGDMPEPGIREPLVARLYEQPSWEGIPEILNNYNVSYVYFGNMERDKYGQQGLDKFNQNMEIAYQNGSVIIYAWKPN